MIEAKDCDGWPLRAGQRVKIGAKRRTYQLLEVLEHNGRVIVRLRAEDSGGIHHALPERCRIRKQTKEERESMLRRARRQLALG